MAVVVALTLVGGAMSASPAWAEPGDPSAGPATTDAGLTEAGTPSAPSTGTPATNAPDGATTTPASPAPVTPTPASPAPVTPSPTSGTPSTGPAHGTSATPGTSTPGSTGTPSDPVAVEQPVARAAASPLAAAPPSDTDVMPDGQLKKCLPAGTSPTFGVTKKLTSLTLRWQCLGSGVALTDWTGSQFLPGLTTLSATPAGASTLPVEGLTTLFPALASVTLRSMSPGTGAGLGSAAKLTSLSWTSSPDLKVVPDLTGAVALTTLTLSSNALTALSLPAGLPQLTSLDVSSNQITALSLPAGLPKLTTLNASSNPITTIGALTGAPALVTLTLSSTQLTDLSGVANLPSLTTLTVKGAQLTGLTLGVNLPKLTTLDVSSNPITTVGALTGAPALVTLTLSSTQLTDISGVADLPSLTTLTVRGAKLASLTPGANLPKLTTIDASSNQIATVGDLTHLASLRTLTLTTNQLTSFPDALPTSLVSLALSSNRISDLPSGLTLPNLTSLVIQSNLLTVLRIPAPHLTTLDVRSNRIGDMTAVAQDYLAGMTLQATSQTVDYQGEDIAAGVGHPLSQALKVPAVIAPRFTAGAFNMAAINLTTGTFTAAKAGPWSLSWTLPTTTVNGGRVTYTGTVSGMAVGDKVVSVTVDSQTVNEGEPAVFEPTLVGLPDSGLTYQWFRGSSASSQTTPIGTDRTLTLPSVALSDDSAYIKLVVTSDSGSFGSTPAQLFVHPKVSDPGMDRCLRDVFGKTYTIGQLRAATRLNCSGYQIASLDDVSLINGAATLDLSRNQIVDLTPLAKLPTPRRGDIDLSANAVSDLTPLVGASFYGRTILDRNNIRDVTPLAQVTDGRFSVQNSLFSARNQQVGGSAAVAGTAFTLPVVTDMLGKPTVLTLDGTAVTGPTVTFPTPGVKELAWDIPWSTTDPWVPDVMRVDFSGVIVVPVSTSQAVLQANPSAAVGGSAIVVRGLGFAPNAPVSVTWNDAGLVGAGSRTDAGGLFTVVLEAPYLDGSRTLIASDGKTTATVDVTLTNDVVVDMPDAALRACVNAALRLPADAVPYRSRLARVAAEVGPTFSCANQGVTDAAGIEALTTTTIDLHGNEIASIDNLATLNPATTTLNLRGNRLTRLGKLAPQPALTTLTLVSNQIVDFSGLDGANLSAKAMVNAVGQEVTTAFQFLTWPMPAIVVPGVGGVNAAITYPDGIAPVNGEVTWTQVGDQQVFFTQFVTTAAGTKVKISGTITVPVRSQGDAQVSVSPGEVYPTQFVNIVATGLRPGERAGVWLVSAATADEVPVASVVADDLGVVRVDRFTIPRLLPAGTYTVRVQGTSSLVLVETSLVVQPYPPDVIVDPPGDGAGVPDEGSGQPGTPGGTPTGGAGTGADLPSRQGVVLGNPAALLARWLSPRLPGQQAPLAAVAAPAADSPATDGTPPPAVLPAPAPQVADTGAPLAFLGGLLALMIVVSTGAGWLARRRSR